MTKTEQKVKTALARLQEIASEESRLRAEADKLAKERNLLLATVDSWFEIEMEMKAAKG